MHGHAVRACDGDACVVMRDGIEHASSSVVVPGVEGGGGGENGGGVAARKVTGAPSGKPPIFDSHRIVIPMHTSRGLNAREHHMQRSRRVKRERELVAWSLASHQRHYGKPTPPCSVLLTRHAPGRGLDSDNLQGALKAVRDSVAEWLGVDDRFDDIVSYRYAQQRHAPDWLVSIEVKT